MNDESRTLLRREMRARRAALSDEAQEEAARSVARQVFALEAYQNARTVMAYVAARGELSVAPVLEDALKSGRVLVLPRCEGPGEMTARRVRSMGELSPGAYGLLEPSESAEIAAQEEIDLILTPGTAFDRAGNRIGQGGGYYDRYLPGTRAVRVGVCHDFALVNRIEAQAHDAQMDIVLTPGGECPAWRKQEESR